MSDSNAPAEAGTAPLPAGAGSRPPGAAARVAEAAHRLTRYQRWRLAVSAAGWLIAGLALLLVASQLTALVAQVRRQADTVVAQNAQSEQLTLALQVQTFQALSQTWSQIDNVFIHRPYLRPYFYAGVAIGPDNKVYGEAQGVAELVLDLFEAYRNADLALMKAFPASQLEYSVANANYIATTFGHSPLLCARLAESADTYSLRLKEIAKQPCARLNTKTP